MPSIKAKVALAALTSSLTVDAKSFLADSPADSTDLIRTAFPLGNGRLGAMPLGTYGKDTVNLNVDTLWSGGPFENPAYQGGNPNSSVAGALPDIRAEIFETGTGDVSPLAGSDENYGSYQVLGNLTVDLGDIGSVSDYRRELNLDNAIHTSRFSTESSSIERETFCSYPDNVCVYYVKSDSLPSITVRLENQLAEPSPEFSCKSNSINLDGTTSASQGMIYNARASVVIPGETGSTDHCSNSTSQVVVPAGNKEIFIVIAADTQYDSTKGDSDSDYSFRGEDPTDAVLETVEEALRIEYATLKESHIKDYTSVHDTFKLTIPDPNNSSSELTKSLIEDYDSATGNPFVESLLFDFGRYLFISSSRKDQGGLPPNLQGLWTEELTSAWSADYHANINLQMNHWSVEQTGLGSETEPLWSYIMNTWMPRGAETANLLYGASEGWTTHNEMNTFGYTGMKSGGSWANYPASNAWMCQHVWDHFDFTQDVDWYQSVGYPIIKGTAQFWLSQLVEDEYFNDGSFVVNPCNSPEQGNTTFGCTLWQQSIWEVFDHVIRGWDDSGDTNTTFRSAVENMMDSMDTGVHVGSWGQIQEWKMDMDEKNNTHRHLSNLYGWYPGYSISSVHATNETVTDAVATTLYSRGPGVEDANAGWEKVWRSACWAGLNNTEEAHDGIKLAIEQNFVANGLSMYAGRDPPFQIDANYGITGAVLAMLVRDLDRASDADNSGSGIQDVLLGPAIPSSWANGKVDGLRLRGGGSVSFGWNDAGIVDSCEADLRNRGDDVPVLQFHAVDGESIEC